MLHGLSPLAREARAWPFEQARNLLARVLRLRLDDAERDLAATLIDAGKIAEAVATLPALARPVVFQCGYGASGLPHLGTFGEVARPTMVRSAFRALTEDAIPTRLIVVSDDMDGFRKIPDNVPNRAMLEEDRDKPVTRVRDPFGEYDSFGAHNNARLRAFLDGFGFDYEFLSSTDCYTSGRFDEVLLRVLERFDAGPGDHAADPGRRAPRDLFAVPADQPEDRPGAAGADAGAPPRTRHDRLRRRGRDPDRGPGHRRPREAAVAAGLGGALDGAGRRLRDVGQGPGRLGAGLQPGLPGAGRRRRRRASTTSSSWTSTTRRSPSPRATA